MKTDIKIIRYFLKLVWDIDRKFLGLLCALSILCGVYPFVNIIFPMRIINELAGAKRTEIIFADTAEMLILDVLFYVVIQNLKYAQKSENEKLVMKIQLGISRKFVDTSYKNLEDAEFLDLESKAMFPIEKQSALIRLFDKITELAVLVIKMTGLFYIISLLNPWVSVFLLSSSAVYIWCHKKLADVELLFFRKLQPINRKFTYYIHMITDYRKAKDIRLYDAEPMISEKIGAYNMESYETLQEMCKKSAKYSCIGKCLASLQKMICYSYMIYLVLKKKILPGQFMMYFTSVYQLAEGMISAVNCVIDFHQSCSYLGDYLLLAERLEQKETADPKSIPVPQTIKSVEFKNVSFKYANAEKNVLTDLSFKISKGEKIALVGTNGAGKTTVVKLIMRFFEPDEGEILLNGINIQRFSLPEYQKVISAIFQDFCLPDATIRENITIGKTTDEQKLQMALKFSEADKFINKLPKGIDTMLGKDFEDSGIELSGGQRQRLAIARMIYRQAYIYLMDEPTAALDAAAENELYNKIRELTEQRKDAIYFFISHRLSLCRLCDKIMVLQDGNVQAVGSHGQLLKESSVYQKMWDAQKQYYE